MEVEFHPDAILELREATFYYQSKSSGLGTRFLSSVEQSIARISTFPESFPVVSNNVRQCKVARFPYAIIYRVQVNFIHIIAIAHSRRKPKYWGSRR